MLKEFKEFIMRGNIVEMAVGVIMGTSFTAVVNGLVEGIIMPLIATVIGTVNVEKMKFMLHGTEIPYGIFLQALINFLLISLVLFLMLKAFNKASEIAHPKAEAAEEEKPALTAEDYLREIRDLLKEEK